MSHEATPLDVSAIPEVAKLVQEVADEGRTLLLRVNGTDMARLSPARPVRRRQHRPRAAARAQQLPEIDVVAATAGVVQYDGPVLTIEEETAAFERAVADEVKASLGG